jgi:hypothetical protein
MRKWSAFAPETVALSDRLQAAYQKILEKKSGRRCRIGAAVFVAGVRGRARGRAQPQEMTEIQH